MKTVQMTLDEALVRRVDRIRKQLRQSRSAFTRDALREHLARYTTAELERKRCWSSSPISSTTKSFDP